MIQYFIAAIIDLAIGGFAIRKRRAADTGALLLVCLCSAAWSFELYLLTTLDGPSLSLWFHVFRVGLFFIPPSLALLAWTIIGNGSGSFCRWVIVPSFAVSLALSVTNLFFLPTQLRPAVQGFLPEPDVVYLFFAGLFVATMLATIVFAALKYRVATFREKHRIKWLLITFLVAFVTGCVSLVLMVYDFYLSELVGTSGKMLFIMMLCYSTVQHHLMDVRLALSVGSAKLLLLSFFCWLYFSVISSVAMTFDAISSTLTLIAFFIIVLEFYPRMLQWIVPNARRLFAADKFDYEQVVKESREKLSRTVNAEDLRLVLDHLFYDVVRVESYRMFVTYRVPGGKIGLADLFGRDCLPDIHEDEILERHDTGVSRLIIEDEAPALMKELLASNKGTACLCVTSGRSLAAIIVLGRPLSSSYYGYEDIRLLEWLGSELTQTLDRVQVLEAFEDELQEAKKRLSLLSMMNHYHHDIKAPLSVIDGVVSHQLYDGEKQREVILEQVALGSKLIATMAGILQGKRQRQLVPVSLQEVMNDCLLIFKQMLAGVDVDISEDAVVSGDPDDLKILFINLVKNAVEAAQPDSKVTLVLTARQEENRVEVSVKDNGVGMDPEKLGRLWELSSSSKRDGNGIGLQAVKRIADEHEASIEVLSSPGHGTEFIVSFPRVAHDERFADTA